MVSRSYPRIILAAAACGLAWILPRVSHGQPPALDQEQATSAVAALQQSLADLIARVEPTVVAIHRAPAAPLSRQGQPAGELPGESPEIAEDLLPFFTYPGANRSQTSFLPTGAGVVIDADGLILTQYLNVRAGDRHTITTTEGKTLPATIKAADPRSGLAVLEVKASGMAALKLGDADSVRKGHFVVTVGNPHAIAADGEPTASWGIVSNIAQKAPPTSNLNNVTSEIGQDFNTTLHHLGTLLQTDAKLGWSAGGGALVDLEGKLIGINTTARTLPGHELLAGYAIPMTRIFRRVVGDLVEGREVEYGLLGVTLTTPNGRNQSLQNGPGAEVTSVLAGSAAARAGLERSDLLIEIDGKPITNADDIYLLVGSMPPGTSLSVGLMRGGQREVLPLTLSKRFVRGEQVFTNSAPDWRGIEVDYSTALLPTELVTAAQSGLIDTDGCVLVKEVAEESPAWNAGVRKGMFISHVGEKRVSTPAEFQSTVAQLTDTVDLRFTDESTKQKQIGDGLKQ